MGSPTGLIGARVRRVEDPRLLRGAGEYVDDLRRTDALHVAVIRSPYAHGTIRSIDVAAAKAAAGVVAVVTAASLGAGNGPFAHPTWYPANASLKAAADPVEHQEYLRVLAGDRVRFSGEPMAAVVATDRYAAEDAARLVVVDVDPLPVLVDPDRALDAGAPLVDPDRGTNLAAHFTIVKGDPDAAFSAADVVVADRFTMARSTGTPIEPRGVLAIPDARTGGLTVWSATQSPHWLRDALARMLDLPADLIRVVAPDVGGGFGVKSMVYPEEVLVPILALRLGRPVRWTETRREQFQSGIQARDQRHSIELALSADGTILGLRDAYVVDTGASNVEALVVPYNTAAHLQGVYRIPSARIECTCVLTNKAPLSAYRGAGRPEAVFAMERILDRAARRLDLDPVELRRRNLVTPDQMPYDAGILYRDGHRLVVDGGDFPLALERATAKLGLEDFREEQRVAAREGRFIGLGIAMYIEGTGIGPFEVARVRVLPSGNVQVAVGPPSQGQGHETVFAQVCADRLGVPMERIHLVQGDTAAVNWGSGTIASRTAVVVGNAVDAAAVEVRRQVTDWVSDRLEVSSDDLVLADGRVHVRGSPDRGFGLGEVAAAMGPGVGRPDAPALGLQAERTFAPETVTFASGVHLVTVEVDITTGTVHVLRYIVVHDCGRVINPTIVEGQIVGGTIQGLGGALLEELVYDDEGQLVNGTFMDYGMPRSTDVPTIEIEHLETPSTRNPLGVKGVGEAGAIAVPAAIAGAVEDALRPFAATFDRVPLTPERVLAAIPTTEPAEPVRAA